MLRLFVFIFLWLIFCGDACGQQPALFSFENMSVEDSLLFAEYKDSFLLELEEMKDVLGDVRRFSRGKPIDTSVMALSRGTHFELGMDAAGPVVSNGRASGLSGPFLSPSLLFYQRLGFSAAINLGFYTDTSISKHARVPVVNASAGWNRTFFKHWSSSLSYSRAWALYTNKFQRGLLNNGLQWSNNYNFWNYISLSTVISFSWSSNLLSKDFVLLGAKRVYFKNLTKLLGQEYTTNVFVTLDHDFVLFNVAGAKVMSITPSVMMQFGNDNRTYLMRRQEDALAIPQSDRYFNLLNIEPGLRLLYRIRNLELSASCQVALPFHVYDHSTGERPAYAGTVNVYGQGSVKYIFKLWKQRR